MLQMLLLSGSELAAAEAQKLGRKESDVSQAAFFSCLCFQTIKFGVHVSAFDQDVRVCRPSGYSRRYLGRYPELRKNYTETAAPQDAAFTTAASMISAYTASLNCVCHQLSTILFHQQLS